MTARRAALTTRLASCYNRRMPAKKNTLTEAERRRRIQETAKKIEVEESPKAFETAFAKVLPPTPKRAEK